MPTEEGAIRWLNYLRDCAPLIALLSVPLVALRALAASYYRPEVALAILAESTFSNIAAVLILATYPFVLILFFGLTGPRLVYALVDRHMTAVAYNGSIVTFLLALMAYSVPLGWITALSCCVALLVIWFTTYAVEGGSSDPGSIEDHTKEAKALMVELERLESESQHLPESSTVRVDLALLRKRIESMAVRIRKLRVRIFVLVGIIFLGTYAPPANFLAVQRIETRLGFTFVGSVLNSSNDEVVVLSDSSRTVIHIPRSEVILLSYCDAASRWALSNYFQPTGQPRCYS